ncbi:MULTISPECIES: hypothetical protein, partial [unclassified Streptomyces]|uniref:hypothetical protein n=1 Tax=unclassified Streptomyces TaxID=2593676 RepID=UPI00081DEE14
MTAPNLPRWVWDLVIAVQRYEEEHPMDEVCVEPLLAAVPADARDKAAAIAQYVGPQPDAPAENPFLVIARELRENTSAIDRDLAANRQESSGGKPAQPTGAVIEIIEKGATTSSDEPGTSVIVPTDVRINGQSLLASADDPVIVHEISTRGDELVRVTLTLFARRVSIRAENDTEG